MPLSVTNTAAKGVAYSDIRIGECTVHQIKLDVSTLTGVDDANGTLPVGLPIGAGGIPIAGTTDIVAGIIGPEPVHLEAADHFGNVIVAGVLNYQAIIDNLGRVWDANELASVKLDKAIKVLPAVAATS
jgi:hypothetical protein